MAIVSINGLGDGVSYEVIAKCLDNFEALQVLQSVRGSSHANSLVRAQSYGREAIFAVHNYATAQKLKKFIKNKF